MINGTWKLEVATPFGTYPATLRIENSGGALTGQVESKLGVTPLNDIEATDEGFGARLSYDFRGQIYDATIAAQIADERIDGTIKVAFPFAPTVRFNGTRAG